MLKLNILATNVIYMSVKHDLKKINYYFNCLEPILEKLLIVKKVIK